MSGRLCTMSCIQEKLNTSQNQGYFEFYSFTGMFKSLKKFEKTWHLTGMFIKTLYTKNINVQNIHWSM